MRFDDLLDTVLAMQGEGTGLAVTRWRQCMDLLAQRAGESAEIVKSQEVAALLTSLAGIRRDVPLSQKIASVVELGSWIRSPVLVRFLSEDHPAVVSATMSRARLDDNAWGTLIPVVGPLARSVLRRRDDLGKEARAALAVFGTTDMALEYFSTAVGVPMDAMEVDAGIDAEPSTINESATDHFMPAEEPAELTAGSEPVQHEATDADQASESPPSEISRIVNRIEAFRSQRANESEPANIAPAPATRFQFETDETGTIRAVLGAPRAAVIGLSIGLPAIDGRSGADGQGLGSFRQRAALGAARFVIGVGALSGEWRLTAEPRFSAGSGRFEGYSGEARRALAHELSVRSPDSEEGWGALSAATARQLVHELRTPLNAIQGFAEIIENEMFGPASPEYREMSSHILRDARTLLATFDDLDLASRLVRGDATARTEVHAIDQLIRRALAPFGADAQGERAITLSLAEGLPPVSIDSGLGERLFMHLFRTLAALREEEERLTVNVFHRVDDAMIQIEMSVPAVLRDWPEDAFYRESAQIVDDDIEGPPLGSAFSFRLVRSLAENCGGGFHIGEGFCRVTLPACAQNDRDDGSQLCEA